MAMTPISAPVTLTGRPYPTYLRVGSYIRVAEWIGQIIDVAVSEQGRVMLLVKSPKMVWRNGGTEWLEFLWSQPNLIQPATEEDYTRDIESYIARCDHTEQRLIDLLGTGTP